MLRSERALSPSPSREATSPESVGRQRDWSGKQIAIASVGIVSIGNYCRGVIQTDFRAETDRILALPQRQQVVFFVMSRMCMPTFMMSLNLDYTLCLGGSLAIPAEDRPAEDRPAFTHVGYRSGGVVAVLLSAHRCSTIPLCALLATGE